MEPTVSLFYASTIELGFQLWGFFSFFERQLHQLFKDDNLVLFYVSGDFLHATKGSNIYKMKCKNSCYDFVCVNFQISLIQIFIGAWTSPNSKEMNGHSKTP